MGGRYLVTGAQLGTLITLCKTDAVKCNEMLNKIVEDQFVWDSKSKLKDDILIMQGKMQEGSDDEEA